MAAPSANAQGLRVHPASAFDSVPRGASREGGNRPSAEQLEHPELMASNGAFARIAPAHLRAEIGASHGNSDSPAGVSPSSPRGFTPRPPRGPFTHTHPQQAIQQTW